MEEIGGELLEVIWGEFVGAEIDVYLQQIEVDLVLLCNLPTDKGLEIAEFLFFRIIVPYLANEYQLRAEEREFSFLLAIF